MFDIGERVVCTGENPYGGVEGEVIESSDRRIIIRVDPATIRDKKVRSYYWNGGNKDWSFSHCYFTFELVDKGPPVCEDWS